MSAQEQIDARSGLFGELRLILAAVQYFTRLPMPAWVGHSPAHLQGTARYFSLVGILVTSVTFHWRGPRVR